MSDAKYKLVESVGSKLIPVTNYDDSHIHHPSRNAKGLQTGQKQDFESGRDHTHINGEFEEVRRLNGQTFVKKDLIFLENGSGNTQIPAPAQGYVYFDKVDGQANIYDAPKPNGELVARVFHLRPETFMVKNGEHIEYGQPLGTQGQTGKKGIPDPENYGVHAHVEYNVKHLEEFKQYILDVNSGVIAPNKYPSKEQTAPNMHYNNSQLESVNPQSKPAIDPHKANILTQTRAATDQLCDRYNITNETHRNNIACGMAELAITHAKHPFKGNGVIDAATIDGKVSIRETNGALMSIISADAKQIGNRPAEQSLAIIADYQAPVMIQEAANQTITKTRSMSM